MPAPYRHGLPFWRYFSVRAGTARRGAEGLRTRCRRRLSHSVSFLPELRQHPLLGRRPQSCRLRGRRGRVRQVSFSTAQRLDLGRVGLSVARPAADDGAPPARPTAGHVSRFSPTRSCSQEQRHLLLRVARWLQRSSGDCCIADADPANSVLSLGTGRGAAPDRECHSHARRARTRPGLA